ncbi:MAG: hypothetical protein JOZ88_11770, partial [Hyphomicrobiales bacterium]|nr:hypothetical protein [Hyphomicrobiales bacterium]
MPDPRIRHQDGEDGEPLPCAPIDQSLRPELLADDALVETVVRIVKHDEVDRSI